MSDKNDAPMLGYHSNRLELPPCSNRGVTDQGAPVNILEVWAVNMRIYRHLDWLSITIAGQHDWRNFLPGLDWRLSGPGRHGYRKRFVEHATGITLETDSIDTAMGSHFTISGEPLAELRALGIMSDDDLTGQIERWDGKCSRADLAIDVWGCTFTPKQLSDDLARKAAHIKARVWRLIDGHNRGVDGATLDTGSKDSDRRFRMYDKGAEKRIKDGEAWIRLELQLRRHPARNAVASCALNGTDGTVTGHIGAYLHWTCPEYLTVLSVTGVPPVAIPHSSGKRRTWLKSQVAIALAKETIIDPEFRQEFNVMVDYWLDKLDPESVH